MVKFACLSMLVLTTLFAARPSAAPEPEAEPAAVAGGCGWWRCSTGGGGLVPSEWVCMEGCQAGTCIYVNVCSD